MKLKFKILLFICLILAFTIQAAAPVDDDEEPREFQVKGVVGGVVSNADANGNTVEAVLKEKIVQSGALEKVEGNKFTLRKVQTRIEFFTNDDTRYFLKSDGGLDSIKERAYLDIRGPKNKKAVLANSIYIYQNKKTYDEMTDKIIQSAKKSFQAPLTGYVTQVSPQLIFKADDGVEYLICYDEDTLWVNNTTSSKDEMLPGNRMKLLFDKRISIRYENYPVKIIIDKSKNSF